jgi:hypothetical protein
MLTPTLSATQYSVAVVNVSTGASVVAQRGFAANRDSVFP